MNAPLRFAVPHCNDTAALWFAEEVALDGYGRRRPGGASLSAAAPEEARDWGEVHDRLVRLGAERAGLEREVCRWLLAAERLSVPARAGFADLREYADRLLGLRGRQVEERLRVGRCLAKLPRLDQAFASGELSWSAVRELSRVATAETEQAWIEWAKGRRIRQLEREVAAREPGDRPSDRGNPERVKHRLSFEVRAETLALFRDLQARVRADLGLEGGGGQVDDDTLLHEIARRALGGPDDEGRASYQLAVTRCSDCGRTAVDAGGEEHVIDAATADMMGCDAQQVGEVDRLGVPGPHVGASSPQAPPPRPRARQTIPPATRRQVLRRDRKRCVVPGCSNHRFLDVHHLDPLSEGGGHDPERLATLCGSHHRAVHAGRLQIEGGASTGFTFGHADAAPYGSALRPFSLDLADQALSALRHLGFRPTRARALVDAVLATTPATDLATVVREALRQA